MPKKKIKAIDEITLTKTVEPTSQFIKKQFTKLVEIVKMTNKGLTEVEMVDTDGNIIIWNGRNFDTNKIKLNNKITIVGKPKTFVEIAGVKKTIIKFMMY